MKTKSLYIAAVIAGLLLAATTFSQQWFIELPLSIIALVLMFVVLRNVPRRHAYAVGFVFFAAWIVPTTYWYYNFMSWWVAPLASFGFAALLANIFRLVYVRDRLKLPLFFLLVSVVWASFTYLRLRVPVMEDWWLPHLGYSVWHNSGLMYLGKFGSEAIVELILLLIGALLAMFVVSGKKYHAAVASMIIVAGIVAANVVVWRAPAKAIQPVAAIQAMTEGGVDVPATPHDVRRLLATATNIVQEHPAVKTIVLPENYIPAESRKTVHEFAEARHVSIVYHTAESNSEGSYKKVVVVDEQGGAVIENYKERIAPDEQGIAKMTQNHAKQHGQTITAYVCYDLHYPNAATKMVGADVTYVPLNDAAYGSLQKQFHAADIALRALQSNSSVVVASTDGPTMIVNSNGVVVDRMNHEQDTMLILDKVL